MATTEIQASDYYTSGGEEGGGCGAKMTQEVLLAALYFLTWCYVSQRSKLGGLREGAEAAGTAGQRVRADPAVMVHGAL